MKIDGLTLDDCAAFPGKWSICPEAAYAALKVVRYEHNLRVLEFGSGEGTKAILDLLTKREIPFVYHAWENNEQYISADPRVHTYIWDGINFPSQLTGTYDLVIVDGPNGVTRNKWYPLLKDVVQNGTILLLDDFYHHKEFAVALEENFAFRTVDCHSEGHECWKVVEVLQSF